MTNRCRSCDAEVVFVHSAKSGKATILDAKPAKGIVVVDVSVALDLVPDMAFVSNLRAGGGRNRRAVVLDVYTDHHATCPNATEWKGRTRRTSPPIDDPDGGTRGD